MRWIKTTNQVLKNAPEVWLNYLQGIHYSTYVENHTFKPSIEGVLPRTAVFFAKALFRTTVVKRRFPRHDVLAFAGTLNQSRALDSTIGSLEKIGVSTLVVTWGDSTNLETVKQSHPVKFSLLDWIKFLILFAVRFKSLTLQLNEMPKIYTKCYDYFLLTYLFLPYFERTLAASTPKVILLSNDHSLPNRILIEIAKIQKIKTIYMQHASVTSTFPALDCSIAFLDGEKALQTYLSCGENRYPGSQKADNVKIFLNGVKVPKSRVNLESELVGVALGVNSSPAEAVKLINTIVDAGHRVIVRWHPRSPNALQEEIGRIQSEKISISNPLNEDTSQYLSKIRAQVAGNSNILLEGALSGVVGFYFNWEKGEPYDYYNFVRDGIAILVNSKEDLLGKLKIKQGASVPAAVLQGYNATVGTEWEGREGDLAANTIFSLLSGETPKDLFGYVGEIGNISQELRGI